MVRLVGLAALFAPVVGSRVAVNAHSNSLSTVDATMARGLEVKELLRENPNDEKLQNEYRDLIGEVEFAENRIFLETGVKLEQEPAVLGDMASEGVLMMAERTGFAESIGRLLTSRRDYVFEQEGGHAKYVFDGSTLSLHSRMHVTIAGEEQPRFVVRRAFNYLNPIAHTFGMFVYRVIQCVDPHDGSCSEGNILYTITKDRLGRGALWGRDEYRVYTGTGGCGRWGHGIMSCDQDAQVMYSLGAGLSTASFDTDFYKGNVVTINGNGERGSIRRTEGPRAGSEVDVGPQELESLKVAHSTKVEGPPRWLNWLSTAFGPVFGGGVELARALIWTDSYRVRLEGGGGAVDDLLLSAMVATQDLTRDTITSRQVSNMINSAGNAGAGAASGAGAATGAVVTGEATVAVAATR